MFARLLELYGLKVVRDVKIAVIVQASLRGVELFAVFDVFVLGVVKKEVFHAEPLRELACVLYRRMVFFVWLERSGLRMEAEGFVKQPLASLGVPAFAFIVGLVAAAGELFSLFAARCSDIYCKILHGYIILHRGYAAIDYSHQILIDFDISSL